MNWQPIKTAPKDKRILLYYSSNENAPEKIFCGQYFTDMGYWDCDVEYMGVRWMKKNNPTHWCELEAPEK
jgi:hypothetical protein